MKITKRQLRRIIREAEGSTKKYDDDSALRGKQSTLPDALQRGIIDKTVENREEHEEEERKERNESARVTRRQLRRIIREEVTQGSSISFDWSPSGMTMVMYTNGNEVTSFSTQREVRNLISDLEELLAGPMSMSP